MATPLSSTYTSLYTRYISILEALGWMLDFDFSFIILPSLDIGYFKAFCQEISWRSVDVSYLDDPKVHYEYVMVS